MNRLVLWSYDASPFTQKALLLLGLKKLDWNWVETPMMPPKEHLAALTGGYRGTPVLQDGADIFIDSQLIARHLEARHPGPTIFPSGVGLEHGLVRWSDAFFRAGLKLVLALTLPNWPAAFRADRQHLFPDIDFDTVAADFAHSRAQFRAHACLLDEQLADGRPYLTGANPGLTDVQAYPFVWLARGAIPQLAASLLDDFSALRSWEQRMQSVGEGHRSAMGADEALAIARASEPAAISHVDPNDAQGLRLGQRVTIAPDDTRRGGVTGEVVIARPGVIAIRRQDPAVGDVVVHFPRLGYRVSPDE